MSEGVTVKIGVDSSAVTTGLSALNDQLGKTRSQINSVATSTGALSRAQREQAAEARKSGQNMLQFAYAADDAQYGIRGLMNNIPMLAQAMGLGAGLAGVISIAAVAVNFLWDKLSQLSFGSMSAADNFAQAAQAIENAQARVAAAARARAEWEKFAAKEAKGNTDALNASEIAFDNQKAAIDNGNKSFQERLKLEKELRDANKALEIAKVDGSDANETTKIVQKGEIELRYANLSASAKLESMNASKAALEAELSLQDEIAKKASETADNKVAASLAAEDAENRVIALQKESDEAKLNAINLYNKARNNPELNLSEIEDNKFDPSKSSVSDILKEANRINAYTLDSGGHGLEQLLSTIGGEGGGASTAYQDTLNKEIGTQAGRQTELAKMLEKAKSEAKVWKEQATSFGDPGKTMEGTNKRKAELEAQLEVLNKQLETADTIAKVEAETEKAKTVAELQRLTEKQKKEQDAKDKALAEKAAAIKPQSVTDAVSKLGGGGYVGTRYGTYESRIAKAAEDLVKKQEIQNKISEQIRDKKPIYE